MPYERAAIQRAAGYTPGKQPASTDAVKLNTNENPYPPAPAVMRALAAVAPDALRRYPPPLADGLRAAAARLHGVDVANVIAVNGGDELIRLAITTFVDPGAPIGVLDPSYSLYPVLAALQDSPVVRVELQADWTIAADAAERLVAAGVRIVFVVNPHAPSGTLTSVARLRELAQALRCVLVIDEAYVDFVDPALEHDAVSLVRELENVLILRTLSKGYSLAGLRCGYGLGNRDLIAPMLTKTRDSYNVDAIAQVVATAALEQCAAARATWELVRRDRAALATALAQLGLSAPPSQANFLLVTVPQPGPTAAELCRALEARAILVRHFAGGRLDDKLRITVGTPEQNARLVTALRELV
jgi:histidinol-phosphate aminotransferase